MANKTHCLKLPSMNTNTNMSEAHFNKFSNPSNTASGSSIKVTEEQTETHNLQTDLILEKPINKIWFSNRSIRELLGNFFYKL